jgi:heat shock protein HspQ
MYNNSKSVKFHIGQIVHHKLFDYRGVIVDVEPVFSGSDEWYDLVAKSKPPKDKPWYHVLPDDSGHQTYVAERNIEIDTSGQPVKHPSLNLYFTEFRDGIYINKAFN